jgi:D-beta-D-heptose 7-phosphate kinase / D-beta-D-heptose 1-phosphate adenosyltransferase
MPCGKYLEEKEGERCMKEELKNRIRNFNNYKVLVIGDAILDTYIKGSSDRLCREAPVPVINVREQEHDCGGAANTAINVAALGAETYFLTVIGKDQNSRELMETLKKNKVKTEYIIRDAERETLAKKRIVASSSILLRIDEGSSGPVNETSNLEINRIIRKLYKIIDAIIISDYGYGIISSSLIRNLEKLRVKKDKVLIIDSKELRKFKALRPTAVKPNYEETIKLLKLPKLEEHDRVNQVLENGKKLMDLTGALHVAATIDADGTVLFEKGKKPYRMFTVPQENKRAIGAGDTFISALALAFCSGMKGQEAVDTASAAAAVIIRKEGTGVCSGEELLSEFHEKTKYVKDLDILEKNIRSYKKDGKKIVFTNGCFDILHRGHVSFLNEAKKLGDILVVAINNDESIRKIKGEDRPINTMDDRIAVLTAIDSIDYLISFKEENSSYLIKKLRPEIFVKGGNYDIDSIQEAETVKKTGGEIKIIPILIKHSTTKLIRKIRSSAFRNVRIKKLKSRSYAKASGMD